MVENDPWAKPKFGPGRAAPLPGTVNKIHERADTDTGPLAIHHTLGSKGNQAAPGDHSHSTEFYLAHAWSPGSLSVAHATFTTLLAGAEEVDPSGMYNQPTGTYTIPVAGLYEITGSVYFQPRAAAANHLLLVTVINGSEGNGSRWSSVGTVAAAGQGCGGSVSRILAVGDTVLFQVYQDSGSACNVDRMSTMVKLIRAS